MNETDFKGAEPYIFGEDFGIKAKEKLDAAAPCKVVYQQPAKGSLVFRQATLIDSTGAKGAADGTTPALEGTGRRVGTQPHQQRNPPDD